MLLRTISKCQANGLQHMLAFDVLLKKRLRELVPNSFKWAWKRSSLWQVYQEEVHFRRQWEESKRMEEEANLRDIEAAAAAKAVITEGQKRRRFLT